MDENNEFLGKTLFCVLCKLVFVTVEQAYLNILRKRVKGLRNALIIISAISVVLIVIFSVLAAVDYWVWICAGVLPTAALWFISSLVLFILWIINRNKLFSVEILPKKLWRKQFHDRLKVLFITLASIMVMVTISIIIHLILIEESRYRVGPSTNVALFSTLIGIAGLVAYVYFFYVFIRIAKISQRFEEVKNKGVIAVWVFLTGLILLLVAGVMDTAIDPMYWMYEYDAFHLTKRILTIISLIIISVGSFYLDTTINIYQDKGYLEKRRNIRFLLTSSSILLPIIIAAEMILRPYLYNRYMPSCTEEYWRNCERYLATETAWFSWIVFGVLTLCLCTYFYSLYLTTLDYKNLVTQIPEEEVVPTSKQVMPKPFVPGAIYPVRIMKPFMVRYDNNVKFSLYSFLGMIVIGGVVCITFLADTEYFEWLISAGIAFLCVMLGAIIVFHIFFTKFGIQIKQIMSYDEKTKEFGSKYYTYTTFGIFFLYLGFFVNIMFTPRITSVFVISRAILVICFALITYGCYNLYKILKYYQTQKLLEEDQSLYSLLPYSSFAITVLLIVETIIRKIIHQIYYYIQAPETSSRARSRFYRQKAVWLGSLDLVFFTLLLGAFLYGLYVIMKDLKPVINQIASENKIDDLSVIRPYIPTVAPAVEYSPPAKVVEEEITQTKVAPVKEVVPAEDMMYCENCGEKIRKEAKFCEFCGSTIQ